MRRIKIKMRDILKRNIPLINLNNGNHNHNTNESIKKYIEKIFRDSLLESTQNLKLQLNETFAKTECQPYIALQFYYSPNTNKVYIEYTNSQLSAEYMNVDLFRQTISTKFHKNFKSNTDNRLFPGLTPEIVLIEDTHNGKVESNVLVTPYTIGYWKSIMNRNILISDSVEFDYYFRKFLVDLDQNTQVRFQDWVNRVDIIRRKYSQTFLDQADKDEYIERSIEISTQYKGDEYKEKMEELNEEFEIKTSLETRIPELFEEYKTEFAEFFGRELPDIANNTTKAIYRIDCLRE